MFNISTDYTGDNMGFSLEFYKIFDAVVKNKSFSAAANALYITQPAVSQAIKQMETEFETQLFLRTKKGIVLTQEGEILSGYISSALSLIEAGEQRVKKLAELSAGTLRIGAGDTTSKWFLTPFVEEFHKLYPGVSISITNRTSSDILKLISSGQVDIGYVNMPVSASGIQALECRTVTDVFIASQKYAELKDKKIELNSLAKYPMIMLERAANSRRWVDRHFLKHGIELEAHDLIAEYVKIGLGIGCVIKEFSNEVIGKDGIFEIKLNNPVPKRSIGVCYPEGIELSAAARKFIDMTRG